MLQGRNKDFIPNLLSPIMLLLAYYSLAVYLASIPQRGASVRSHSHQVKNDYVKNDYVKNDYVKNDYVKNDYVKNDDRSIDTSVPKFMESSQCFDSDTPTAIDTVQQSTVETTKETPLVFQSCYTAPDEELSLTVLGSNLFRSRELCAAKNVDSVRDNQRVGNPKIECAPGFTEVQTYYNLDTRSTTMTKYGSYWCKIKRVCCK